MIKFLLALTITNTIFILITRSEMRRAIKFQHQFNKLVNEENTLIFRIMTGAVDERAKRQDDNNSK